VTPILFTVLSQKVPLYETKGLNHKSGPLAEKNYLTFRESGTVLPDICKAYEYQSNLKIISFNLIIYSKKMVNHVEVTLRTTYQFKIFHVYNCRNQHYNSISNLNPFSTSAAIWRRQKHALNA